MPRISLPTLAQAITLVRSMSMQQKELLVDEIFKAQPNLLGSVAVLHRMGVSLVKVDFLLNILLVCFMAMKGSGHTWPLISLADQDQQMGRFSGSVKFGADLAWHLQDIANQQYIDAHAEKNLLAYVIGECVGWLQSSPPEESDKYVLLAAISLTNCIAIQTTKVTTHKRKKT